MTGKTYNFTPISQYYWIIGELGKNIKKTNIKNDVCLHSERQIIVSFFIFGCLTFVILKHSENNTLKRKIKKDCQTFDSNLRKQI